MPTEKILNKRSVRSKYIQQGKWNSYLAAGDEIVLSIFVMVGFQQKYRLKKQILNKDNFNWLLNKLAQREIRIEQYLDAGINLQYAKDDYSQHWNQIVSCFQHLNEDDIYKVIYHKKTFEQKMGKLLAKTIMILVINCLFLIYHTKQIFLLLNQW